MTTDIPLVCPEHGGPLVLGDGYQCAHGCRYPIVDGIARFVPQENYAASFGLQWNAFRRTQLDSFTKTTLSRDRLARIAGGSLEVFRGQDVLEAGCGAGRFSEVMLAAGAKLFAADLSSAVEANRANCSSAANYFVCQADITRLPVAPGQFDVVVCVGVIQHTPDPERTMSALCSYVKPGGLLLIDHYSLEYPATLSRRLLRRFLLGRSSPFSLRFCTLLTNVLWPLHRALWLLFRESPLRKVPLLPKIRSAFVLMSPIVDHHHNFPELSPALLKTWALLDTHDTLTDAYKHLRSQEQIETHLQRCGMESVQAWVGGNGIEAHARKSAAASNL